MLVAVQGRQAAKTSMLGAVCCGTFSCFMPQGPHASHGAKTPGGSEKLMPYPHLDEYQYRKLITSRASPFAHAYDVWMTSDSAFVSYPAHGMTDRQNKQSHYSGSLCPVL